MYSHVPPSYPPPPGYGAPVPPSYPPNPGYSHGVSNIASHASSDYSAYDKGVSDYSASATSTHILRGVNLPMRVHMLRLLPGADIVLSLLEFAQENGIQAAVILTCVGGTGQTTLRPANTVGSRVLEGMAYEIASLTGTLSGSGHNLHLTVSDSNCQVFSGHALGGTLVRTTCELVIGEIENVSFQRTFDS